MGLIGSPDVDFCLLEGRPLHNITTIMNHKQAQILEDITPAGADDEVHAPTKSYNFEASIEGFYNVGAGLAQEGLELEDNQVLMYALEGNAIGDPFTGVDGVRVDIETIMARAALHRIRANFKALMGPTSMGVGLVQTPYVTKTDAGTNLAALDWGLYGPAVTPYSGTGTTYAATTVTDAAPWDLALGAVGQVAIASSGKSGTVTNVNDAGDIVTVADWLPSDPANGETCRLYGGGFIDQATGLAIGFLGVSAIVLDGAANVQFTIQECDTVAGVYADLIAFTAIAAVGGERKTATTPIEQYTQLKYTHGGGAARSITFAVGLVRSLTQ